jgi:hypothetical protein
VSNSAGRPVFLLLLALHFAKTFLGIIFVATCDYYSTILFLSE